VSTISFVGGDNNESFSNQFHEATTQSIENFFWSPDGNNKLRVFIQQWICSRSGFIFAPIFFT
jgi:hypothetical protein